MKLTDSYCLADEMLLDRGWVQISETSMRGKVYIISWHRHLTPEQVRFLRPYFESDGIRVREYMRERWEKELECI